MIKIENAISETLLIPLYMKYLDAQQSRPILNDPAALRLVPQIDYDFTRFRAARNSRVGTALRARYFDQVAYEYESQDDEDMNIPILKTEVVSSLVKVPYYDIDFAGGWSSEELFSQTKPSFIISSPDFDRSDFACNLIGNSISNRIRSGSIIGLKRIDDWQTYFPTNELYGVITKNQLRTVKIVKRSKQKGFLELIPDPLPEHNNPPYETELIPMDYVVEFYQVVASAFFERISM